MSDNDLPEVPVVMCTWNRFNLLPLTLDALDKQTYPNYKFYIWNNNPDLEGHIEELLDERDDSFPVEIHHHSGNVGGFGRFIYSSWFMSQYDRVIFIDDDQQFSEDFIGNFADEFERKTVRSFWSWRFQEGGSYHDRVFVDPGDPADYCGTGGMLIDISIFRHLDTIVDNCPSDYVLGMEDLWISYFADHVLDWDLYASGVTMEFIQDGNDVSNEISDQKGEFLELLREEKGWDV